MSFDDLARRAADAVRRDTADSEPPPISKVASKHTRRNIASVAAAAFVLTAAAIGGAALTRPVPPTLPALVATQASSTTTTTVPPGSSVAPSTTTEPAAITGWAMSYPGDWFRADSELMPNLGWDSTTVATFPLRPGGERCAHVPENALRDLGPGDALVTVFFAGSPLSDSEARPAVFNDETFPESGHTDNHQCPERPELEIHWGGWNFGGEHVYTLVAFGANVDEEVRATAWKTLTSLDPTGTTGTGHDCVVTLPGETPFVPSEPYAPEPVSDAFSWYGTDGLWTVLPVDGVYVPTKSVWWSQAFDPQVSGEWTPDISVRYDRLDAPADPVLSEGPGTNAHTAEDGWFMIAHMRFTPPAAGCWRVTAEYKSTTLSFVVNVPPELVDS